MRQNKTPPKKSNLALEYTSLTQTLSGSCVSHSNTLTECAEPREIKGGSLQVQYWFCEHLGVNPPLLPWLQGRWADATGLAALRREAVNTNVEPAAAKTCFTVSHGCGSTRWATRPQRGPNNRNASRFPMGQRSRGSCTCA